MPEIALPGITGATTAPSGKNTKGKIDETMATLSISGASTLEKGRNINSALSASGTSVAAAAAALANQTGGNILGFTYE